MEYVEVLDQDGKPTGEIKDRAAVHRDGDWHRTVHVWIRNSQGQLLVQRRAAAKDAHPNMWDMSFAGHIVAGEDSITTVVKEAEEELGLSITPDQAEYLFSIQRQEVLNNGTFINNVWHDVYLLEQDVVIADCRLQPDEVAEIRWFAPHELARAIELGALPFVPLEEEYEKLFAIIRERWPHLW